MKALALDGPAGPLSQRESLVDYHRQPICRYRRQQWGEKFDKLVRCSADETDLSCPKCGSKQAERLASEFGERGFSPTPKSPFSFRVHVSPQASPRVEASAHRRAVGSHRVEHQPRKTVMDGLPIKAKKDLCNRLSRIEGHARGVHNMLDGGRSCHDILHQLRAILLAAHSATALPVRDHARECVRRADQASSTQERIDGFIMAVSKIGY